MQNVKQWTADFIVKMIKHMQLIVRPYIYTTDHQNKRGRHINMCRNETFRFLKKKRLSHRRIPSACNVTQKRNVFLFLKF